MLLLYFFIFTFLNFTQHESTSFFKTTPSLNFRLLVSRWPCLSSLCLRFCLHLSSSAPSSTRPASSGAPSAASRPTASCTTSTRWGSTWQSFRQFAFSSRCSLTLGFGITLKIWKFTTLRRRRLKTTPKMRLTMKRRTQRKSIVKNRIWKWKRSI